MNRPPVARILLWTPRVLGMLFALLLAMFAMDAFVEGKEFWETSGDFVNHLIPALSVLAILMIGWRRDGLASLGFVALSAGFFIAARGWVQPLESIFLVLPPIGISLAYLARMLLLRSGRDAHGDST